GRQAETFTGPGAQINVFAALTAKGPEGIAGRINAFAAATGAHHQLHRHCIFIHGGSGENQEHSVSSKVESSVPACSRSSLSWRIRRTETMRRLPLISGIRPSAESIRRRSS